MNTINTPRISKSRKKQVARACNAGKYGGVARRTQTQQKQKNEKEQQMKLIFATAIGQQTEFFPHVMVDSSRIYRLMLKLVNTRKIHHATN